MRERGIDLVATAITTSIHGVAFELARVHRWVDHDSRGKNFHDDTQTTRYKINDHVVDEATFRTALELAQAAANTELVAERLVVARALREQVAADTEKG